MEMIPEHIPSACLDNERVDINIILKFFDLLILFILLLLPVLPHSP